MNQRKRDRQDRAMRRLEHAVKDIKHEWKSEDGTAKAHACIQKLLSKGVLPT